MLEQEIIKWAIVALVSIALGVVSWTTKTESAGSKKSPSTSRPNVITPVAVVKTIHKK